MSSPNTVFDYRSEKHQFAYFSEELSENVEPKITIFLKEKNLVHRLMHVVRSKVGDQFILFNEKQIVRVTVTLVSKKEIVCLVDKILSCPKPQPVIDVMLPVLKREALEQALYVATVTGVRTVYLVKTEKSIHWSSAKEYDRLKKICIAAAEQSKQFILPTIYEVMPFSDFLKNHAQHYALRLHADVDGDSIKTIFSSLEAAQSLLVSIGPEGDFTSEERALMQSHEVSFVHLTSAVLKSEQALLVILGMIRSF